MLSLNKPLILASASQTRGKLLRDAGIAFEAVAADIDEAAIKSQMLEAGATPEAIALRLAQEKAAAISAQYPEAYVIGSDQILCLGEQIFDKAPDAQAAREKLIMLRGRTHHLISAASIFADGQEIWAGADQADITMDDVSDAMLERYIEQAGEPLTRSVGAYEMEALGVHLLRAVRGDYFTILGMPLLQILAFLREQTS